MLRLPDIDIETSWIRSLKDSALAGLNIKSSQYSRYRYWLAKVS
uniref:Uncharacterized protein n=1 Tax=Anguilla anguilla TaxID=7936 RepID=A0A0E9RQL3_ANGAN